MNSTFNIYMCGVGGQGIGVLAEVLLRAAADAGLTVKAVDTHGLAQRGGMVESHLRIGCPDFSPLIEQGKADLCLALERTEAMRAVAMLRKGGMLAYYDTLWQPLQQRLGRAGGATNEMVKAEADKRGCSILAVGSDNSVASRHQNMILLSAAVRNGLVPGVSKENCAASLNRLFQGGVLKHNLEFFAL